jgi:hypothetical protein
MTDSIKATNDDVVLFERLRGGVRISVLTAAMFSFAAVSFFVLYHQTLSEELKLPSLVWFVLAMLVPGLVTGFHSLAMCCYRACTSSVATAESVRANG